MPRIAVVRSREFYNLLLRMGFVESRHNDHWRFYYHGLRLWTKISFGRNEIPAAQMGRTVTQQLQMSEREFRAAMNGDIPERFTNPRFWTN